MLAMVAVGAMAMMFELRIPFCTRARTGAQSRVSFRSTSMYFWPRASIRICCESSGRMPLDHSEPWNVSYEPRSSARSQEAWIA
ncbi:hypothetical protein D3C74_419050 [compost metagenome]